GLAAAAALGVAVGLLVRKHYEEANRETTAAGLVHELLKADIAQVPEIVKSLQSYRRWTDPELKRVVEDDSADPRTKLPATLALPRAPAPHDPSLEARLLEAPPIALPVLRDALEPHRADLSPRLWAALEAAKPGDSLILPAAAALALYDPDGNHWIDFGAK